MDSLVCNFSKCRKKLKNVAWLTTCSHVFCEEDFARELRRGSVCPACRSEMAKDDYQRVNLEPGETYKSMVITGQRPEVIVEICSRALTFWTYQACQERVYLEHILTKTKEKNAQLETYYETTLCSLQNELKSVKKEYEATKKEFSELRDRFQEKNRQYLRLQGFYDRLRRNCITPQCFEVDGEIPTSPRFAQPFRPEPGPRSTSSASQDDMMLPPRGPPLNTVHRRSTDVDMHGNYMRRPSPRHSPPQRDASSEFVLRPRSTPVPLGPILTQDPRLNGVFDAQGQKTF